ncbi:MAG: hypothetical protein KME64_26245 [Scytonematopsis contorta HA4267-MV1]|nr:hypothetical protein [Scytonematopsis contorta HA4267-MV1]
MKTQNLNLLNGLEAIELTNVQMEVITGGNSKPPKKNPLGTFGAKDFVGKGKIIKKN